MENSGTKLNPFAVMTGASNGIGLELARQFAKNGYDLIVSAQGDAIQHVAEGLKNLGIRVEACQADLSLESGIDKLYAQIQSFGRPVDAIAINAGVGVGGAFDETSWEAERNLISLNVLSTTYLTKKIVKDMCARGSGKILLTASIASVMPAPFEAVYAASKAFIYSLAESLHNELKPKGITVTALMPGPTNTNFFHRAGMDDTKAGAESKFENEPVDVARQGFEALMSGKDHVVAASLKTKLQGAMGKILPEQVKAAVHRGMSEPGTAPKH